MIYKGLIVDFGGVLTTPIFESFADFCREHGVDPVRLRDYLRGAFEMTDAPSPIHRLETGHLHHSEWESMLAQAMSEGLDSPIDPSDLTLRLFSGVRPEPSMVGAVQAVRQAGSRTALCSNSWGPGGYPREMFDVLFDAVVISGEVGMRKPDPQIYLMAASKLGLSPEECVFVDDFQVNVAGAEAVGMKGVHHSTPDRTIGELRDLFALPLMTAVD